jgi:hypothetical protein
MAHTKVANLETNDFSEFDGTTGTDLTVAAAAKYAGSYGVSCALADTTARYTYWNTLGNVTNSVVEFYFDPNTATLPGFVPICELLNNAGDGVFRVYIMRSTGQSTYTVAVGTRQYTRQSSYALGSEQNQWSLSMFYYNMTDAFHKIRLDCKLAPDTSLSFDPLYSGQVSLFVDDVLIGSVTENSGVTSLTRRQDGGLVTVRFGACETLPTGSSGTLYFDNHGWSKTYSDLLVPPRFRTQSDTFLFRGSTKEDDTWLYPMVVQRTEGSSGTLDVLIEDAGVITSATVQAYLNNSTNALFATSACTANDTVITTPSMSGLVGNNTYVIEFTITVDGRTIIRKLQIQSVRHGEEDGGIFVEPEEIYKIAGSSDRCGLSGQPTLYDNAISIRFCHGKQQYLDNSDAHRIGRRKYIRRGIYMYY